MRSLITVILCATTAVVSGYARFGGGRQLGAWVDLLFLASTAIVVAVSLGLIMERMRRISRSPSEEDDTRDHS